jgi:hypothetical protein
MAEVPHSIETQIRRDLVKWTRAVAGFTGLLFLANVVANFFIYQQWRVANEAQVDTRSQLRAFVKFTGGSIIITNDKYGNPTFYIGLNRFAVGSSINEKTVGRGIVRLVG